MDITLVCLNFMPLRSHGHTENGDLYWEEAVESPPRGFFSPRLYSHEGLALWQMDKWLSRIQKNCEKAGIAFCPTRKPELLKFVLPVDRLLLSRRQINKGWGANDVCNALKKEKFQIFSKGEIYTVYNWEDVNQYEQHARYGSIQTKKVYGFFSYDDHRNRSLAFWSYKENRLCGQLGLSLQSSLSGSDGGDIIGGSLEQVLLADREIYRAERQLWSQSPYAGPTIARYQYLDIYGKPGWVWEISVGYSEGYAYDLSFTEEGVYESAELFKAPELVSAAVESIKAGI